MAVVWKYKPFVYLSFGRKNISGRNNTGKITRYHRGGGCKKKSRLIDYKRYIWNVYGFVLRIEYDPLRSSLIALICYSNGILSYILAPEGINVGDSVISREAINYTSGNATLLSNIPIGIKIHCVELEPNKGGQLIRSAGSFCTIVSKSSFYVVLKLKSGELRKVNSCCMATVGAVSNFEFAFRKFLKAGYFRQKGWRPVVRGVAMNPIDHPHGGGQGKTSGGRPSVSPKAFVTKGKPTRKSGLGAFIVKRRG